RPSDQSPMEHRARHASTVTPEEPRDGDLRVRRDRRPHRLRRVRKSQSGRHPAEWWRGWPDGPASPEGLPVKKKRGRDRPTRPTPPKGAVPSDLEVAQASEDGASRRDDIGYSDYALPAAKRRSSRRPGEGTTR